MGLKERTAYRLGFLRSEIWQSIRAQSLVRWDSTCFICLKKDFGNDVHHIFYATNLGKTNSEQTRILCRDCHKEVHRMMKKYPLKMNRDGPKNKERLCNLHFNQVANLIFKDRNYTETTKDRYALFAHRHPKMRSGRRLRAIIKQEESI